MMNFLRALLFCAVGVLATILPGGSARAQSADALQAARELMALTTDGMVVQIVTGLINQNWPRVESSIREKNPAIEAATMAALRKDLEKLQITATIDVLKASAPIYAKYFTVKELRDLIAFHRTPSGKKALIAMPQANLEMLGGLNPRLQSISQDVNRKFADILKQKGLTP